MPAHCCGMPLIILKEDQNRVAGLPSPVLLPLPHSELSTRAELPTPAGRRPLRLSACIALPLLAAHADYPLPPHGPNSATASSTIGSALTAGKLPNDGERYTFAAQAQNSCI